MMYYKFKDFFLRLKDKFNEGRNLYNENNNLAIENIELCRQIADLKAGCQRDKSQEEIKHE